MSRRKRKHNYTRCKKCRELVSDAENCANCANKNPLSFRRAVIVGGKRGAPTLDIIEGNPE